jgi:hypothetical protein
MSNELNHEIIRALKYTAGTPGTRLDAYHVAKISAAWTVDLCAGGTGAPDIPYGIVQPADDDPFNTYLYEDGTYTRESYKDGSNVAICIFGECMAIAGTGGFTAGKFVMADASGHVIDHVPGGHVLGKALETATVGNKGRIDVAVNASADASSLEKQVASANGAITISNGIVIITKGGIAAMTLADPTTANNYDRLYIQSNTANAHTVTADWNGAGSAAYTFPAEAGATIVAMAYGGKWLLPTTIKCASFVGALTGNATTATTASSIATASVALSGEITGNASAQNYAHGLGTTPSVVIAIPSDLSGGVFTVAYGSHGTTNAVVTVTNGEKYRVLCIK